MGSRALLACLVVLAGCDKTQTVTRVVNLHLAPSCPITTPGSFGVYVATGDYEPPEPNHSTPLATDQPGQTIDGIPPNVQSLALTATIDTAQWLGVTLVPPSGDIDMLLLPSAASCVLNGSVGFTRGMVFAAASSRTLVASGGQLPNGPQPSFRIDLDTGRIAQMQNGIGQPRVDAATAALGDGRLMVTGGVTSGIVQINAQLFDEARGDFDPTLIPLPARTGHGAVTLANGDVFLAGGKNASGLFLQTERIHFDAASSAWIPNEGTTPLLATGRNKPSVLRLADGTVLVGGGFDDSTPTPLPVPNIEFFSADATTRTTTLVLARPLEDFVALDGGGALFVAAPETGDPVDFHRAYFVAPGTSPQPVVPDVTAPLTDVKLFARVGGGALLWTGATWLAFDPWTGFSALAPAPSTGPELASPIASADAGLHAWIDSDGAVAVWRDSVRNAFATEGPYLTPTTGTDFLAPASYPPPTFDAVTGLHLVPDQTVFVADARYLDLTVEVDATDSPPLVVLRGLGREIVVGGVDCPYPPTPLAPAHVYVERRGAFVNYSLGGALSECATVAPDARLSVGIRGGGAGAHALDFSVARADDVLH